MDLTLLGPSGPRFFCTQEWNLSERRVFFSIIERTVHLAATSWVVQPENLLVDAVDFN